MRSVVSEYRAGMIAMGDALAEHIGRLRRVKHGVARLEISHDRPGCRVFVTSYCPEPTLEQELATGPLGAARALDVALRLAHTLVAVHAEGAKHGNLTAEAIAFPPELDGEPVLALPLVCDPDEISTRGDVAMLAATLQSATDDAELLAVLATPPATAAILLARLEALPAAREVPSGAYLHPREAELVAALGAAPADASVRAVYADWLEQRGDLRRARFVRGHAATWLPAREADWRRIVSTAPVIGCDGDNCPERWDLLEVTPDGDRRCAVCAHSVAYATKMATVHEAGSHRGPVAVDLSLEGAPGAWLGSANPNRWMRMNPPPPPSEWDDVSERIHERAQGVVARAKAGKPDG